MSWAGQIIKVWTYSSWSEWLLFMLCPHAPCLKLSVPSRVFVGYLWQVFLFNSLKIGYVKWILKIMEKKLEWGINNRTVWKTGFVRMRSCFYHYIYHSKYHFFKIRSTTFEVLLSVCPKTSFTSKQADCNSVSAWPAPPSVACLHDIPSAASWKIVFNLLLQAVILIAAIKEAAIKCN